MNRFTTVALVLVSLPAAAQASITGVSGTSTWLLSNPASAQVLNLTGPNVYAWDEQFGVVGNTAINTVGNGTFTGFAPYNAGFMSGGFFSHMLHFDPGANPSLALGSVTFSQNIVALIFDETMLSASDATMGSLTTIYDTGNFLRSYNGNILGASSLTVSGSTINFQLVPTPGQINRMFEVRVITVVPAAGTMGLAGLSGLVALRRRR